MYSEEIDKGVWLVTSQRLSIIEFSCNALKIEAREQEEWEEKYYQNQALRRSNFGIPQNSYKDDLPPHKPNMALHDGESNQV